MYYTVPGATPLKQLMGDAMILARGKGYDVFNALDLLQVIPPQCQAMSACQEFRPVQQQATCLVYWSVPTIFLLVSAFNQEQTTRDHLTGMRSQ